MSHVQFSNGCRLDLEAFGRLKAGRRLVVSASQSAGALPIDVKRSGVDALACSGHKWLCAGYGAGFVYVSRSCSTAIPPREIGWMSVEEPYRFDNRSYKVLGTARRMELGCPSFGPIFALGAAVDYLRGHRHRGHRGARAGAQRLPHVPSGAGGVRGALSGRASPLG